MEIALIDDDSLYRAVFLDFFNAEFGVKVSIFKSVSKFGLLEAKSINFIVVDHTLLDGSGVSLIERIRPHTRAEICIISTHGEVLRAIDRTLLGVSGDFKKRDLKAVGGWYSYLKSENKKKLQKPHSKI